MTFEKKFTTLNNKKREFGMKKCKKFGGKFGHNRHERNEKQSKDRIAKRLAMLGIASRREAEKIILEGKVKVNGIECKDLTQLVSYEDKIAINGKEIANKPIRTQIFMMNKPAGYVTSNNDPQGRKTIFDLIPSKFGRLIAIGRLDYNTEGLLLLTNNGELSRLMEMPATGLKRVYYARVIGEINDNIIKKLENLRNGIKIEGTEYGKMIVEVQDYSQTRATLRIVIFEGKNNEIRRIMWHLGLKVVKLTRVQYGDFRLNGLPEGCVQESHFKIDIRDLERQISRNIKRYNEKKEKAEDNNAKSKQKVEKEDKTQKETDNNLEKLDENVEEIKENVDNSETINEIELKNEAKSVDVELNEENKIEDIDENSKTVEDNSLLETVDVKNETENDVKEDDTSNESK